MFSIKNPVVLILGGAGAQNAAVTRGLSAAGTYCVHVLTRSIESAHAAELGALPNVKLIEGDCYDEATLESALKGVDLCFVNTNGFAIGEKNEIFWGIRMYEIARWAGVKHFIYSSLPYVTKNGDFDPKRRVPFVDGKAKVTRKYLTTCEERTVVLTVCRVPHCNATKAYGVERCRVGALCRASLGYGKPNQRLRWRVCFPAASRPDRCHAACIPG